MTGRSPALFYAALNLIQAYLLETGVEATTHVRRRRAIMQKGELETIVEPYALLQMRSEGARYDCRQFSSDEYLLKREGAYTTVITHLRVLRGAR